jgi:hypothetical protein
MFGQSEIPTDAARKIKSYELNSQRLNHNSTISDLVSILFKIDVRHSSNQSISFLY